MTSLITRRSLSETASVGLSILFCIPLVCCNSSPPIGKENIVGGASISSVAQIPLSLSTTQLVIGPKAKPYPGQYLVADLLSYSGKAPAISAPTGWTLIRDDSTVSVRQSIYGHAIEANDPGSGTWNFSQPVDAQGIILVLDNVLLDAPLDGNSGDAANVAIDAKPITTRNDGDLLLVFFATDFKGTGLSPQLPTDLIVIAEQNLNPLQYWILGAYQSSAGETEAVACPSGQLYNAVTAQIAIQNPPAATTPATPNK